MLVFFEDARCTDLELAGGKGASLARMTALGMPVPPGFVVLADALVAALAETVAAIRAVLVRGEKGEDLAVIAAEAQALVQAADSGGAFPSEIAEAYAHLGDREVPVAVRDRRRLRDRELRRPAGDLPARSRRRGDRRTHPRMLVLVLHRARALLPQP